MAKRYRTQKQSENGNGGETQLIKELWQAAVNLRGSIEPADYKRYILPIIFLRFLSLRFEKRREELQLLISDEKSEYYTRDAKEAKAILDDSDEYHHHEARPRSHQKAHGRSRRPT